MAKAQLMRSSTGKNGSSGRMHASPFLSSFCYADYRKMQRTQSAVSSGLRSRAKLFHKHRVERFFLLPQGVPSSRCSGCSEVIRREAERNGDGDRVRPDCPRGLRFNSKLDLTRRLQSEWERPV